MASNYYNGYYNRMITWPYDVLDSSNPWMLFFDPDEACCSLMVQNGGWPTGYTQQNRMWLDTWGDGQLMNYGTSNYQIYGWDDGNLNDHDCCSKSWYIESGCICTQIAGTQKSYCYKSWGDGYYDTSKGEEWDDGNQENGDGWSDQWKVESGYACIHTVSPDLCVLECGDGLLQSGEEWDDKNNMDLDGWSSKCKVEEGYAWSYNATLGFYQCSSVHYSPVVSVESVDTINFSVMFVFNDTMRQSQITSNAMSLSMTGNQAPYTIRWSASFIDDKHIKLSFSVSPQIIGRMNEVLKISLTDIIYYKNIYGIAMASPVSFEVSLNKIYPPASITAAAESVGYAFLITFGVSVWASILSGSSMELMWSMSNTLQIIYFLGLMSLYYPPHTLVVFNYIAYSNFQNPIFSYV